jgi:hypothetical protein
MQCRPYTLGCSMLMLFAAIGCVDSTRVGLSNVRGHAWRHDRTDGGHDEIANGDDSCQRPGSARPDPAPVRLIPCPSDRPVTTPVVANR